MKFIEHLIQPTAILLVDDCKTDRALFREHAEEYNIELIECTTGEEALAILGERDDVKLVVLDLVLNGGGMDGLQLLSSISKLQKALKVIVMSGYVGEVVEKINSIKLCPIASKNHASLRKNVMEILNWCHIPHKCAVAANP